MPESLKARARRLKDNYNLTIEEDDKITQHQGDICWVCGRPERVANRRLATDHSHLDGLIRGKLCSQCNPLVGKIENAFIRLGMYKQGLKLVHIVLRIAKYLDTPPAIEALGRRVYGWPGKIGTKKQRKFLKKARKSMRVSKPLLGRPHGPSHKRLHERHPNHRHGRSRH